MALRRNTASCDPKTVLLTDTGFGSRSEIVKIRRISIDNGKASRR